MWPFLFVLAIVPLIFYWSDSARALFPALADWLPDKESRLTVPIEAAHVAQAQSAVSAAHKSWTISKGAHGTVAWADTPDGRYRLVVGCTPQASPVLELRESGKLVGGPHRLNFRHGLLPLTDGHHEGADLIGALAQFGEVYVQDTHGAVLTRFSLDAPQSGRLARTIEADCRGQ
jgi:hypothetical protein